MRDTDPLQARPCDFLPSVRERSPSLQSEKSRQRDLRRQTKYTLIRYFFLTNPNESNSFILKSKNTKGGFKTIFNRRILTTNNWLSIEPHQG